ncbi:polysaccharide deacetylase family protein [Paucisalibacillus sp. EB02]|uniref:polysaccharide deacetylase family protein n=1 Tax=Paucisalibacillus sp. EB02 TaxID=1347087 RepID=UPI001E48F055|nr:polysaccharide deacetylase family protein [Paucisalibacillus sp. EB02]
MTTRKKYRLNKKGKVAVIFIFLMLIILTYFTWGLISNQKVVAKNSNLSKTSSLNYEKPSKELVKKPFPVQRDKVSKETLKKDEKVISPLEESGNKDIEPPLETGKIVYLTFDDGPHPIASKEIIELLDQYDAKATFFMLEPNMNRNTEIVKTMKEKGHTLGVHGITHDVSKVYKSPENFVNEMNRAIDSIHEISGINTHLVRAPYGSKPYITPKFKEASDKNNFILWDWNVDSRDWQLTNGEFVENTITQVNHLVEKEPIVILLHEKTTTSAHLKRLLQYFVDNGYEMRAINEWMIPVQFK